MTKITDYQTYIHQSRYARFNDDLKRRETWQETVNRYVDYFANKFEDYPQDRVYNAIINMDVMPSMRALMTAGPALERDPMAGFNCAAIAIDHPRAFDEAMYVLMCGTGLGFSVERKEVNQLPTIPEKINDTDRIIVVRDSKAGWASGFRELIECLYQGESPKWDFSRIRPAGSRLKTFGGRASGPEPLGDLFRFTGHIFKQAAGRKLTSLEVHDVICKIAQVVVVGGVRRSALISLSDLSDERMRGAKNGAWYDLEKQRALANNSVAYKGKPDIGTFMKEWHTLYESRSGERGIFNRDSMKAQAIKFGRRDPDHDFLTNPLI